MSLDINSTQCRVSGCSIYIKAVTSYPTGDESLAQASLMNGMSFPLIVEVLL